MCKITVQGDSVGFGFDVISSLVLIYGAVFYEVQILTGEIK
jgi:hypothetical protein